MIHTCPRCELRFERETELRSHLDRDHGMATDVFEPLHYTGRTSRPPRTPAARRFLVVANRTLDSSELDARIRELAATGPAHFFLLVPADPAPGETPDEARRLAESRLRLQVDRLHEAGIDAEGAIGAPDPFRAVDDILERQRFDEIVLSTLPPALSRWLASDLGRRLERTFELPVSRVTATV
jgi:GABA permease